MERSGYLTKEGLLPYERTTIAQQKAICNSVTESFKPRGIVEVLPELSGYFTKSNLSESFKPGGTMESSLPDLSTVDGDQTGGVNEHNEGKKVNSEVKKNSNFKI